MMLRSLLPFLLACTCATAAGGPWYVERGGAPNALRKFRDSQKNQAYTKVTFFGGSITQGAGASKPELCYRSLLMKALRESFPGATLAENNSAIGGTGSWLGAFRTRNDALYGGAALVFVEFAVNDGGAPEQQVIASMEGIVRQIVARDPTTDIVFLYTLAKQHLDTYREGKLPERVEWHERVAKHYGIPSVNMAGYAAAKLNQGELTWEEFSKDTVHPTDRGYALFLEALQPFLTAFRESTREPVRHTLPAPLSPAPMEKAQCVPYEWAKLGDGWKVGQRSPVDRFLHVLTSDQAGTTLSLNFKGSQIGYFDAIGPDSGDFEYSIDGGDWKPRQNFDSYCQRFTRAHARLLADGLDPAQPHELRLRVAAAIPENSKGRRAQIGWFLVDGEVQDPFARPDPLARIDAIYAAMDPVAYTPAANRWRNLDATIRRLREGGTLKMVMLGDSIIGDTSSSKFELLLERMYPKTKVEKTVSTRGSTGCWWYKLDNHVEEYVLRHRPDLLIIGGISQREDVDSIREVIRQVRATQSPEILLITPAFGALTDRHIKEWTFEVPAEGDSYRTRLRRLAEEEKCGFLDMTGPWWRYVHQSGKDYGWFQRDRVHANDRGFQILGRVLEAFFRPDR